MDTYLLDTNLVSALYDARRQNHESIRAAVAHLNPASPQLVSIVTIAELRYGLALSTAAGQKLEHIEVCIERAEEHHLASLGRYTAEAYALVKSSVARHRVDLARRIPRWVEGWTDRVSSELLQIDENDLWLAAQAVERNYVLLTCDRDFVDVLAPAVSDLRAMLI